MKLTFHEPWQVAHVFGKKCVVSSLVNSDMLWSEMQELWDDLNENFGEPDVWDAIQNKLVSHPDNRWKCHVHSHPMDNSQIPYMIEVYDMVGVDEILVLLKLKYV
jgi:hypothetical protein